MIRPKQIVLTAAGTSQAVPLDYCTYGYAIGITKTNAVKYTLQHTFTDPWSVNLNSAGAGVWFDHDDVVAVNASANCNTNFSFTPSATRLVVASAAVSAAQTSSIVWTLIPSGDNE